LPAPPIRTHLYQTMIVHYSLGGHEESGRLTADAARRQAMILRIYGSTGLDETERFDIAASRAAPAPWERGQRTRNSRPSQIWVIDLVRTAPDARG
jgi:hypothetical protein